MKTIVSLQELLENEIKPTALLGQYRALVASSVAEQWPIVTRLRSATCPGCRHAGAPAVFERLGFVYRECDVCHSLYVSPRPDEDELTAYFRDSKASRFWREQVLPATAGTRLEKLAAPRADWIIETIAERAPGSRTGLDLSPYGGAVTALVAGTDGPLRRIAAAGPFADIYPDPSVPASAQPSRIADIAQCGPVDVVLALDTLDRVADTHALVSAIRHALRPGGLLFVTAPSASGFELQTLWDRSPSVMPPDKLNILSMDGFRSLFAEPSWELLELSTPGLFDVEIVRRQVMTDPTNCWPRVVRGLVGGDETACAELQEHLQRHRLASFVRMVARRA